MVKDFPQQHFIGGGEESFGWRFCKRQRRVTASLLICEIAAYLKGQNTSIWAYLQKLYDQYGHYREALISQVKKPSRCR